MVSGPEESFDCVHDGFLEFEKGVQELIGILMLPTEGTMICAPDENEFITVEIAEHRFERYGEIRNGVTLRLSTAVFYPKRVNRLHGEHTRRIRDWNIGYVDVIDIDRRRHYLSRYPQAKRPKPSCFNVVVHFSYVYLIFSYAYGLAESQVE